LAGVLDISAINATDAITNYAKNLTTVDNSNNKTDFATVLKNAISGSLTDTQSLIDQSEQAEIDFAIGNADSADELGIAQQKASLAVSYTVAVRDRFLDAYKEIMQIQI